MASGDRVGDAEHIVRYAKPSQVSLEMLSPAIFDRDPRTDDDGLSVCRLGVFDMDPDRDLDGVRAVLWAWRPGMKRNGRLVELCVADVVAAGEEASRALHVSEDPLEGRDDKPPNPAHALIGGLPFVGSEEGELGAIAAADILARKVLYRHPVLVEP